MNSWSGSRTVAMETVGAIRFSRVEADPEADPEADFDGCRIRRIETGHTVDYPETGLGCRGCRC